MSRVLFGNQIDWAFFFLVLQIWWRFGRVYIWEDAPNLAVEAPPGEASSQLPAPSGFQAPGWWSAGLLSLGCGVIALVQARLQNSQAGTGQVLAAEAGAQPGSWGSRHTVLGFVCQPAALGLAGTSGAGGDFLVESWAQRDVSSWLSLQLCALQKGQALTSSMVWGKKDTWLSLPYLPQLWSNRTIASTSRAAVRIKWHETCRG